MTEVAFIYLLFYPNNYMSAKIIPKSNLWEVCREKENEKNIRVFKVEHPEYCPKEILPALGGRPCAPVFTELVKLDCLAREAKP